ncbi:MAG TPA: CPBP family glutamic-type intramembrane protease, partial [Phytomonospora sp.]
ATPTSLVLLAVLHPVAVELLFRGVITDRLGAAGLAAPVVVAVSALLFALVQPTVPLAIVGAVFGLAAGALRVRTASVAAAVAAHYAFVFAGAVVWAGTGLITTDNALIAAALAGTALAAVAALPADRRTRAALPPGGTT